MSALSIVKDLTELAPTLEEDYHIDAEMVPVTMTLEEKVFVMKAIDDCKRELNVFRRRVEQDVMSEAGERRFVVEDLGEVRVRRGMKRTKWQKDELVPRLVSRIIDEPWTLYDELTGELHPPAQIAHNVASRLRDCISFGNGKVTGLESLGLVPADWCVEEPKAWHIELPWSTR